MERPRLVVFGVGLGVANLALGLLGLALFGVVLPPGRQVSPTVLYAALGAVQLFGAILLYWIWSGRNWARILLLVSVLVSLLDPASRHVRETVLSGAQPARIALWILQEVLGVGSLIAFFLPTSHRWFMALRPRHEGELARGFGWFLIAVGAVCLWWFVRGWLGGAPSWERVAAALFWGGIGYAFARRYRRATGV